ncbi:MAG: hypothetical protein O3B01_29185 [Planctomycetota bacterium]|nr:hypothetical protein [Planctomycetota bacterium]MDA1142658.1 hypothetical protein [Planctomycetota bacterium]
MKEVKELIDRLPRVIFWAATLYFSTANGEVTSMWLLDAEVATVFEDNLSRSRFGRDQQEDYFIRSFITAGRHFQLSNTLGLFTTAQIEREEFFDFDRLNHTSLSGTIFIKKKFGIGLDSPWLGFTASGGREDFRENARDAFFTQAGFKMGKRFGNRINLIGSYMYDWTRADDNRVFDTDGQSFSLSSEFSVTPRLIASLGYQLRPGEIVTHASGLNGPGIILNTFDRPMRAFNVGVKANIVRAGLSWGLTERSSLNFVYEYLLAERLNFDYENKHYELSLNFSF